jgi:hypothetical protein
MTTAYTSLLGLALPVTGELSGTWGDTVNNSITSLVDTAVAGTTNVSADSNVTLTTTTGASNQARQAILLFSGARTAIRTVTAPAQSKIYTVINATTGGFAVTLVGAGPTTGVTIANGARTVVAWNGSDFVEVSSPSSIILPGGTANGVLYLNGSKVVTSGSALVFDGTNLGVGTTSPSSFAKVAIQATTGANALYIGTGTQGVFISATTSTKDVTYNSSGDAAGGHVWQTGNTERARMTSGGNLLIGTTDGTMYDTNAGSDVSQFYKFISTGGGTSQAYGFTVSNGGSDAAMGLWGLNSASKRLRIAGILGQYTSSTAGSEASVMTFSTMSSGVLSERARINSSGNMGIGTTSPNTRLSVVGAGDNSTVAVFGGASGGTGRGLRIATGIPSGGSNNEIAILDAQSDQGVPVMAFQTAGTERARITSGGDLLVGTTSTGGSKFEVYASAEIARFYNTSGQGTIRFVDGSNVTKGSIVWDSTLTVYNTTSDYRLKTVVGSVTGHGARIDALKPVEYTWNADGSRTCGFLAHQFQEVYATSVTGTKDAIDADGNPVYQQMQASTSEVIADLVAEIQSLRKRLADAGI